MKEKTLKNGIRIIEADDNSCRIITKSGEVLDFDSTGRRNLYFRTFATIYNKSGVDVWVNDLWVKPDKAIVVPEPLNNQINIISSIGTSIIDTCEGVRSYFNHGKLYVHDDGKENEYGRKIMVIHSLNDEVSK